MSNGEESNNEGDDEPTGTRLYVTDELGPCDVLLGRGTGPSMNAGNIQFREAVEDLKTTYVSTNSRKTKKELVRRAVEEIQAKNGRFLVKLSKSEMKMRGLRGKGAYEVVRDDVAMEKTKQAIRYVHYKKEPATTSRTCAPQRSTALEAGDTGARSRKRKSTALPTNRQTSSRSMEDSAATKSSSFEIKVKRNRKAKPAEGSSVFASSVHASDIVGSASGRGEGDGAEASQEPQRNGLAAPPQLSVAPGATTGGIFSTLLGQHNMDGLFLNQQLINLLSGGGSSLLYHSSPSWAEYSPSHLATQQMLIAPPLPQKLQQTAQQAILQQQHQRGNIRNTANLISALDQQQRQPSHIPLGHDSPSASGASQQIAEIQGLLPFLSGGATPVQEALKNQQRSAVGMSARTGAGLGTTNLHCSTYSAGAGRSSTPKMKINKNNQTERSGLTIPQSQQKQQQVSKTNGRLRPDLTPKDNAALLVQNEQIRSLVRQAEDERRRIIGSYFSAPPPR